MTPPPRRGRPWVKVAVLALFVAAIAAFFAFDGTRYLTLDAVKQHGESLRTFTETHYAEALVLAFVVYAIATTLSLPSGTVLSLTFGFLFGRWVATALVVTAGTLGATILFLSVRYLLGEAARRRLGLVGERINEGFTHDGFNWLLFLRLTPFFPYFLVNLVPALTDIRIRIDVAATFVGILPSNAHPHQPRPGPRQHRFHPRTPDTGSPVRLKPARPHRALAGAAELSAIQTSLTAVYGTASHARPMMSHVPT